MRLNSSCGGPSCQLSHSNIRTSSIAHGSVEQVYATGLDAGRAVTLSTAAGQTVATSSADELGGVLFRKVKPGGGYRVERRAATKSGPLRCSSTQSAPPSTDVYDQAIPDERLRLPDHARRHQAGDLRPSAQDVTDVLPGVDAAAAARRARRRP